MNISVFEAFKPEITDTNIRPDDLASTLTEEIRWLIQQTPINSFSVIVTEINDRAQVHCEKWVEEIGLHLIQYATAIQSPDLYYPTSQSTNGRILKNKVYSGDVSGTIGEALFSLYLSKCLFLSEYDFAHLKADKSSGVYPDFAVYIPSPQMISHFNWTSVRHEIPVEVKNANEPTRASIRPRLLKAIQQIRNFWNRKNEPFGPSLIGLTVRNQNTQAYDLVVIWR